MQRRQKRLVEETGTKHRPDLQRRLAPTESCVPKSASSRRCQCLTRAFADNGLSPAARSSGDGLQGSRFRRRCSGSIARHCVLSCLLIPAPELPGNLSSRSPVTAAMSSSPALTACSSSPFVSGRIAVDLAWDAIPAGHGRRSHRTCLPLRRNSNKLQDVS